MPHKSKMLIHTKMEKNSLTEFRRSLIHGIPSLLLVSALSIWSIKYSFLNTIIDLKNSAPSVRITPSSLLVAYFPIMSIRSEEHTSELQSQSNLVCRLLLEKKKKQTH